MPSSAGAGRLAAIHRHPIKSIGWQELDRVSLEPGRTLPCDRHWALAHEAARFDEAAPAWRPKRDFVRGVAAPPLMAVRATLASNGRRIDLSHPDRPPLAICPDDRDSSDALKTWISPLWPDTRPAPDRLVSAGHSQALTDQERPVVSILNLASLREMSALLGQDLSPHRLRGNLWLDGLGPWAEFGWIGERVRIGPVTFLIEERITRCLAINGNPETGAADVPFFEALDQHHGHEDFGVFARVASGGDLALGDPVSAL